MAQTGEELDAGVTVGRVHADLALKFLHGEHRVVADAAVGPTGIEAQGREAALNLLNFRKRWRAFAAGEFLHQGLPANHAITEVDDR